MKKKEKFLFVGCFCLSIIFFTYGFFNIKIKLGNNYIFNDKSHPVLKLKHNETINYLKKSA